MIKRLFSLLAVASLFACAPVRAEDVSITAANVVASSNAVTAEATAGAAIAAGQLIYLDTGDLDSRGNAKAKLSDGDSATALVRTVAGMALNSAAAGQPLRYVVRDPLLTIGGTTAVNTILILSSTPGGVAPAADLSEGEYLVIIGAVISASSPGKIKFDPSLFTGVATPGT